MNKLFYKNTFTPFQFNLLRSDSSLEPQNLFENFFETKLMVDNKYEDMVRGMTRSVLPACRYLNFLSACL